MKLKVNRLNLIKSIVAKVKEAEAAHEKDKAEYEKALKATEAKYVTAIEEHLKAFKAGKVKAYASRYGYSHGPDLQWPDQPALLKDVARWKAMALKLGMATDEEVVVDDKSDYFSFLD